MLPCCLDTTAPDKHTGLDELDGHLVFDGDGDASIDRPLSSSRSLIVALPFP